MRHTSRLMLAGAVAASTLLAGCAGSGRLTADQKTRILDAQRNNAQNAAQILDTQRDRPNDRRIPRALIRDARCVGVFPNVTQAGLVVGASHGSGLVSCRDRSGDFAKAPPAAYDLTAGSLGLQAGAQTANVIVLFQSEQAVQSLLDGKIGLNGQMSATAGPSGWDRTIGQGDRSPVYLYSQSTGGLYAGLNLQGGKIGADSRANTALYGPATSPSGILLSNRPVPPSLSAFNDALRRWAAGASNTPGSS